MAPPKSAFSRQSNVGQEEIPNVKNNTEFRKHFMKVSDNELKPFQSWDRVGTTLQSSTFYQNRNLIEKNSSTIDYYTDKNFKKCVSLNNCRRRLYKKEMCKKHFIAAIMKSMRKEIRNIYRGPEKAYAALDFSGIGFITQEVFLDSMICKRIPFTLDEVRDFFFQTNAFVSSTNGMNYDSFKKTFFPHLYQLQDGHQEDDDDDNQRKEEKLNDLIANGPEQQEIIQKRVKFLEKKLRERFANFDSVRKAFLGLDTDYDGYITVEDILRYFGQDSKDFNFNDLKKLIMEKDSSGKGRLGYADFSKWVGNSIHQSEGFYFRHDSVKNPAYEQANDSPAKQIQNKCKEVASQQMINQTLEKTIIDKIKFQWKTIRKAFSDLNKERDSAISEDELRFYLKHWGLNLTDDQFQYIFQKFDVDRDGQINYNDFHKAVGSEIHPGETLYFRQDKPHMMRINKCEHPKCWQPTVGLGINFCALHNKMYLDQGTLFFQRLFAKIGERQWPSFIMAVKKQAEADEDYQQIFFDRFTDIVEQQFNFKMTPNDKSLLIKTFPGRNEGLKIRINIAKLYDVHYNNRMTKVYKGVEIGDNNEMDAQDVSGYIGVFHRNNSIGSYDEKNLPNYSLGQLASKLAELDDTQRNNRLAQIMRTIKSIDQDNNGYVTSTELDDILKINFPELINYKVKPIFKEFESIQNKILIDYKRFRDRLLELIKTKRDAIQERKLKIAEKLYNLRDSRSNQSHQSTAARKSTDGRLNQSVLNLKQEKDLLDDKWTTNLKENGASVRDMAQTLNIDQDFPDTPMRRVSLNNKFNQNDIKAQIIAFRAKHQLKTPTLGNKLIRQKAAYNSNINLTVSHSTLDKKIRQSRDNKDNLAKSLDQPSIVRRSLAVTHDKNNLISPYTQQNLLRQSADNNNNANQDCLFRKNSNLIQKMNNSSSSPYNQKFNSIQQPQPRALGSSFEIKHSIPDRRGAMDKLKNKLQYEWKNIYRMLSSGDIEESGRVTKARFNEILQTNGTFISNEEIKILVDQFGDSTGMKLNYNQMSEELGLHSQKFDIMRATHSKINKLRSVQRQGGQKSASHNKNIFKMNNYQKSLIPFNQ